MKTRAVVLAGVATAFFAANLPADPYSMAMQQARKTSDANAAEQRNLQQQSGGGAGQSSAPAAPAPMDPALKATLSNINSLKADIGAYNSVDAGQADSSQRVAMLNDLSAAGQGPNKATPDAIKKLATDLITAVSGNKKLTAAQQTQLGRDIHALFNSSHLTDAQQKTLLDGAQKILTDAGISLDNAVDVVTDLKEIASQTK